MRDGWKRKMIKHPQSSHIPRFTFLKITPWLQLFKVPLCLPIALSAGFGYLLHTPEVTSECFMISVGVLFLAWGAAGLNSLQEINRDSLLRRTKKRPLVTGLLTRVQVLPPIFFFLVLGLFLIALSGRQILPLLLGISSLVLYNGIYTPLKTVSSFSLIPGACAGSLPPLIGWTGAGGLLSNFGIWLVLLLFFMWQIPHFFIVLLKHKEDYQGAEVTNFLSTFSEESIKRLSFSWLMSSICISLGLSALPGFLTMGSRAALVLLPATSGVLVATMLIYKDNPNYRYLFYTLNGSLFITLLVIAIIQVI